MLVGIDYGSKMAGTTVIAFLSEGKVSLVNSEKKQDADLMINEFLNKHTTEMVGIDAPLSLPNAYTGKGENYFYRECDKALKAMSPMFLGGLTARAMQLNAQLAQDMLEVYPGALARALGLKDFYYKGKAPDYRSMLNKLDWEFEVEELPQTSHQMDAILALYIIWKVKNDRAQGVGDPHEGLIHY